MLKSYKELRKVDVTPYCEYREAKDDHGKKIEVPYLNWAKAIDLLYENGAEKVWFYPCTNENGSSLIMSDQTFTDSKGNTNRCYETRIHICIDDMEFESQFPVMNGSNPVKDNSMTQQRLWNAQTRAFVKGIAIRTGLGFDLWISNDEESKAQDDDLSKHSLWAVKERMQIQYTRLMTNKGMGVKDIAEGCEMTEEEVKMMFAMFAQLDRFEKKLNAL